MKCGWTVSRRVAWSAVVAAALALVLAAPGVGFGSVTLGGGGSVPVKRSSVVVGVTDLAHMARIRESLLALGGTIKRTYRWNAFLVGAPLGEDSVQFSAKIRPLEGVKYAVGNATVRAAWTPNDTYFNLQWGLPKIGAPAAWDMARGAGVRIAIIDSGIDLTHPDFAGGKVVDTTNTIVTGASVQDDNGHGTHVAGIASAVTNNNAYVAGVAPDAWLIVAKSLNASGTGSIADTADAIRWAADAGANVVSLSMATPAYTGPDPMGDAVAYAQSRGCLVVAAAGNYDPGSGVTLTTAVLPAAYPGVVGVGWTTQTDAISANSVHATRSDGQSVVVLSAPGEQIASTYPLDLPPVGAGGVYMSGTSMAAPHVAGAAALIWSKFPYLSAAEVVSRLTGTALDLGAAGRDTSYGYGRIRIDQALDSIPPSTASDAHGTYYNSATITLTPSDDLNGSGVAATYYNLDGDIGGPGTAGTSASVSTYGTHNIEFWSVDHAGNVESPRKTYTFLIDDTIAPTTTSDAKTGYGPSALITLTPSDNAGGSGVARTLYTIDDVGGPGTVGLSVSVSGFATHTVEYWSEDNAGNVETPRKTATFMIGDLTPPVTTSDAVGYYSGPARIHLSAVDEPGGSGVASTFHTLDGVTIATGSVVDIAAAGTHTLQFWSVDVAGNEETPHKQVTFTVAPVPTTITIGSVPTVVRLPRPFVLSGVLTPGTVGTPCVVYVKKPGLWRWSYSSARLAYTTAPGGGAVWWYRYTPKLRGYYAFYVRYEGGTLRLPSQSRTITVRVR